MPLELIGAGLGRTGTLSLKLALEQLGFGPCYHMVEVFSRPTRTRDWIQAADGELEWETVFEGYVATVDYPGCVFWRELSERYPKAKVLLTVRDPDSWFESTQSTIFSPRNVERLAHSPLREFFDKTVKRDYGDRLHDRAFMTEEFARHNAEVQRSIASERLLVYEVSQGWEPLCAFLGVPVPNAAFPKANTREDFAARSVSAALGNRREGSLDLEEIAKHAQDRIESLKNASSKE
ncbi:MAG TPA: sulfotransferase [Gammaproteobacteria bacterium]|nr:sulfotransferase [Gammaproteobacteria bacterium]